MEKNDNLKNEYRALKEKAVLVPLLNATPLKIVGTDRIEFLHGQVSNDVKGLKENAYNTSLMLNVKGHVLSQMQVFKRSEDLFVTVEGGKGELVKQQFNNHIIFDQVEIHDLSDTLTSMTLLGKNALEILAATFDFIPQEGFFQYTPFNEAKVLINATKRGLLPAFDLHVLKKDAASLFELLYENDIVPAGEELLKVARVEAGIASASYEGGEGVLPQEIGLEWAISYNKGCYLGQEIMARIEARASPHKKLVTLFLEALPNSDERVLFAAGKNVGRLGTVVNHPQKGPMALASLRKDAQGELVVAGVKTRIGN